MSEEIIIIGGGGHAKVVIDAVLLAGDRVIGVLDDGKAPGDTVLGIPVLGGTGHLTDFADKKFVIAIGDNAVRKRIAGLADVRWHTVIHPTATVSRYTEIGEGTVILPGTIVNAGAVVGRHCIINTGAIVEHDCRIADYVHLSPRVCLGGSVRIGEDTWIGLGASVKNNRLIAAGCIVGAGAVVVKDITESGIYVGVPARRMQKNSGSG